MAQDYRTKKDINQTQALFTNGLFIGVLLGILLSIGVTLFITSGKSPFVFKDTEGACIEINSAFGDEDVIAIDEEASLIFMTTYLKAKKHTAKILLRTRMIELYNTTYK